MKRSTLFFLTACLFFIGFTQLSATNPVSSEAVASTQGLDHLVNNEVNSNVFTKLVSKVKKGLKNLKSTAVKAYYKVAGMFDDPVRKWMWFWLIFGLLALILISVAIFAAFGGAGNALFNAIWYLGWASSLFSSVSFVIWIIKLIQS